ncbi:MAG TPA: large conductance mechanosensitive channel protein MscL [Thermomicrobiales bacterium]|nr:large conductance mechanosensitive channel protein MscL [Thermomicrobiales bacterium]
MLQEFKAFALRGNMIDLAIAFILGVAFSAVITSIVDDLLMPIIGAIVSDKDVSQLTWDVGGAQVRYGNFINTVVMFLIVAWILFMIVRAINRVQRPAAEDPAPNTKECPFCLSSVPLLATRCPQCTSELAVA